MAFFDLLAHYPVLLATFLIITGLLVGSFLNVVIYRLPLMMNRDWERECREFINPERDHNADDLAETPFNLATPNSHCPSCDHAIRAWENIPVLSYLILRGQCSSCSAPISPRYPIIECVAAALALICGLVLGTGWALLGAVLLSWSLLALTMIDFDHQLLPDQITLPLLWAGLLVNYAGIFTDLESAVLGAVTGYLVLWTVYWIFKLATGRDGMGYGDFKLLAALGAWLGWQVIPMILLLSSFVGAVFGIAAIVFGNRERSKPIPFGPYLATAGWIALLWGQEIFAAYWSMAGVSSPQ